MESLKETGPRAVLGGIATGMGAAALLIVVVAFMAGPFAPQPDLAATIGDMAAGLREAAGQTLQGAEPAPTAARPWDIDRVLAAAAGVLGALAIDFGALGILRRESMRFASAGMALGIGAITFQVVAIWVAAIVAVIVVLVLLNMIFGIP